MTQDDEKLRAQHLLGELRRAETLDDALGAGYFSDDELLSVLRGTCQLTQRQRLALALSPADRQRLGELRHLERARALLRWREAGRGVPILALHVAADDQIKPLTREGTDFTVRLIPFDLDGRVWKIQVQIDPALAAETPTGFRLLDTEDIVWLQGRPSSDGELVGYWERKESLWERVHRVGLRLLPL